MVKYFQDLSIYINKRNSNITFSHLSSKHLGSVIVQ